LVDGLNTGKVSAVGMDVFENEPEPCRELVNNQRVSVTPHIGGSTFEAQKRIGEEIVTIIEKYCLNRNLVNA
jgi:D-3-phosphoglycerate dehydrogenase